MATTALRDTLDALAVRVQAVTVLAVTRDPAHLNTPGVLVGLPAKVVKLTGCTWSATVAVTVVAAPPGGLEALNALVHVLPELLAVCRPVDAVNPTSLAVAGVELPGYLIPTPITWETP